MAKVALVTGCAAPRSIGRAIALRLAADGFNLVLNDLPSRHEELGALAAEVRDAGRKAIVVPADVTDPFEVDGMTETAVIRLGSLDVAVANAGISQIMPLLDLTIDDWDRMMAINVKSVFLTYRSAARRMIEVGRGGKIIGAASIVAHRSDPYVGHYSASKHAVRGLTQAAAQEWACHGITVNAYCPGIVNTTLWDMIDARFVKLTGVQPGEPTRKAAARAVLGRMEEPKDVAALVSFLAGPDSNFITGQALIADGGIVFA